MLLLGIVLFISSGYFYQAGGWNQNSRFALTRAIVEKGTINIDAYHEATGDKAFFEGHFYSDKAPGQSFLAVPIVAAVRPIVQMIGIEPSSEKEIVILSYLATLFTSALPAVVAALLLFFVTLRLGASQGAAVFATLVFGIGCPAWAYATLFMGHSLAAMFLMLAFMASVSLLGSAGTRSDLLLAVGIGLSAGCAVITEYPAVPAVLIILFLAVFLAWSPGRGRLLPIAAGIAAGIIPPLIVLAVYHRAAFGSILATPLQHLYLFPTVTEKPFSMPGISALAEIILGSRRGLLPLAPVLTLVPLGFFFLLKKRNTRAAAIGATLVALYYILFNASFATPFAGWSYGPRYIGAALPFLCIGLVPLWTLLKDALGKLPAAIIHLLRAVVVLMALYGIFLALVAVSTTVQPPEDFADPVRQLLLPAFFDGDLSLNHQSFTEYDAYKFHLRSGLFPHDAWNVGQLIGLKGLPSLLPLMIVWICAGILACWWLRKKRQDV